MNKPDDALLSRRPREKCDREVKLHLPERLFEAILRAAYEDDRAVSVFLRHKLSNLPEVRRHLEGNDESAPPEGVDAG